MGINKPTRPSRPLPHQEVPGELVPKPKPKSFLDFASEEEAMKWAGLTVSEQAQLSASEEENCDEDVLELPLEFSPIKLPPPPSRPRTPEDDPADTKFGTAAKPTLYLDNYDGRKNTLVRIGGFGKLPDRENLKPSQLPAPFSPGFPPPSNDHYHLSTSGHLPEDPHGKDSYFQIGYINNLLERTGLTEDDVSEEQNSSTQPSMAAAIEPLHIPINFKEPHSNIQAHKAFTSKFNLLDPRALDGVVARTPNDFCRICKEFHIVPGEPDTLPKRDTCGSYIPDWHRPLNPDQSWAGFAKIYSDLVDWVDQDLGFDTSTGGKSFHMHMEYHPEHPKWRETTYPIRGGIWMCRSVHSAPQVERTCHKCHATMFHPSNLDNLVCKKLMIEWVHYMLKYLGLHDVQVARTIVHRMVNDEAEELVNNAMTPAWRVEDFAEFEAYYENKADA